MAGTSAGEMLAVVIDGDVLTPGRDSENPGGTSSRASWGAAETGFQRCADRPTASSMTQRAALKEPGAQPSTAIRPACRVKRRARQPRSSRERPLHAPLVREPPRHRLPG